jgi:hypothetical protein
LLAEHESRRLWTGSSILRTHQQKKAFDINVSAIKASSSANSASKLFSAIALTAATLLVIPTISQAELIRIEAIGKASFVNEALGNSFTLGETGLMILTYDTDAIDTDPSPKVGKYAKNAIKFFQILDANYNSYFTYTTAPGGTITVTDGGATGDGFILNSFSGVRSNQDPNDGIIGPQKNGLPLLKGSFVMQKSLKNAFSTDQLPTYWDDSNDLWSKQAPPSFSLQYCSSCGDGNGFGRAVTFTITDGDDFVLTDTLLSFSANGNRLIANWVIDGTTLDAYARAMRDTPSADSIVLKNVGGSADDDANLVLSHKIHKAGMKTHVPADGLIASGGVDLFLAGTDRSLEKGACVGVHSWKGNGVEGASLPRNSSEHDKYLAYFKSTGIQEALYWFTLQAAPANGMHYMTQAEIDKYGVTTSPAPVMGTQAACDKHP